MNLIEEIKSKVTITELLNRLGLQVNSGGFINSIYNPKDKTPSLKIYPGTNSYYCYSTSKGGDLIDFFADYCNVDKSTAIKELAEMFGITSQSEHCEQPNFKRSRPTIPKPRQPEYKSLLVGNFEYEVFTERAGIIEYHGNKDRNTAERLAFDYILLQRREIQTEIYTALYNHCTNKGISEAAFEYLTGNKRGLTADSINRFKLFSITDTKTAIEFLKDTFTRYELQISGLFSRKYFVFTKHQIVIPYIENDKIVYLRGRYFYNGNSTPEKFGKYIGLNNLSLTLSPKRFFSIDLLNKINAISELIIAEGEFDCIIATQHGNNCIGISGVSNFPTSQITLLKHFNIYLLFDSDAPGKKAAKKIQREFEKHNQSVKIIKLKGYKDITEMYCNQKRIKGNGIIK